MTRHEVLSRLLEPRLKLATVSGVLTTRPRLIEWVDRNIPEIEVITTKSYQVRPNPGNREPILVELEPGCYGNAVGLRNPGMESGFLELEELRHRRAPRALLCVSLSADCIEDFILLARRFEPLADILELNFSCPHAGAGYGAAIGSEAATMYGYVWAIRRATRALLFPKLTPNVPDIGAIARAAVKAGADGIAAINTVGPEVFREPFSGEPVLYNPNGHRGGKSGEWITEIARGKVAQIRRAVGAGVPLLGMGGVATGEDARLLREAGADVVGLGSVFARVLRQEQLPAFVRALKADALGGTGAAGRFLSRSRRMEYRPFRVAEVRTLGDDLILLRLDGTMKAEAGEFAFLFLPGVGEKPFSVARSDPLTFLVRRRGEFTSALFDLEPGDQVFMRGVYGAPAPRSQAGTAYLVAGGTGLAVVPALVAALRGQGKRIALYYGVSAAEESRALDELGEAIAEEVTSFCVPDSGQPGRILEVMEKELAGMNAAQACFYNIGPHPFLERAMAIEERLGAAPRDIFACLETLTMCGVGLCGGCECGGRLLCKEGSFVSLEYLCIAGIRLRKLEGTADQERAVTASAPAGEKSSLRTAGRPTTTSTAR